MLNESNLIASDFDNVEGKHFPCQRQKQFS